jgi:23S rRNA pseudouridine2605 synthase/23S rRNA pseudouridine2604 synthase
MTVMRLHKFLSEAGVCSRRKAEEYIEAGRVRVNGQVVNQLGTKVDPDEDRIEVDGRPVEAAGRMIYVALHKPVGVVTSCSQPGERIVLDLVDLPVRVYPVGRLDKDSSGLLLLTNDGRLHHRLSHPSFDHEKEYLVSVAQPISDAALRRLREGLSISVGRTRPADIRRIAPTRFAIVLMEGKNRQIRRMVGQVGGRVVGLKRIRIGPIRLGKLKEGTFRHLTEKEKSRLLQSTQGSDTTPHRPNKPPQLNEPYNR